MTTTNERTDSTLLLHTLLSADATLLAALDATTERIYGGMLGVPSDVKEPKNFVVFANMGGPGHIYIPMAEERFDFHCYGADIEAVQTVFRTLHDALHRLTNSSHTIDSKRVLVRRADLVTGPRDLPEPEINFPRIVSVFRMIFAEYPFNI